eukprot:SAG31_NODE_5160_length_2708_cov_1.340744_2_plen_236_part_00
MRLPVHTSWPVIGLQCVRCAQVWNEQRKTSICANLSSTEGSIVTPRGLLSGSWTCGGGASGLCGQAAEHQSLKLSCDGSGTIAKIDAAFFGTPSGSCASGFKAGSCNAAGVVQKLATKCVGKPECTVDIDTELFGDPCFDTKKSLAVQASGCGGATSKTVVFTYTVTIPVGSTATVSLPMMGKTAVEVTEGKTSVFANGKFIPAGTESGIMGASIVATDVVLEVGSGTFDFAVLG